MFLRALGTLKIAWSKCGAGPINLRPFRAMEGTYCSLTTSSFHRIVCLFAITDVIGENLPLDPEMPRGAAEDHRKP